MFLVLHISNEKFSMLGFTPHPCLGDHSGQNHVSCCLFNSTPKHDQISNLVKLRQRAMS